MSALGSHPGACDRRCCEVPGKIDEEKRSHPRSCLLSRNLYQYLSKPPGGSLKLNFRESSDELFEAQPEQEDQPPGEMREPFRCSPCSLS